MRLLILFILLIASPAFAVDRITALVEVTNAAGTTNGQTITVNGAIRTWTNNVVVSSTQILTNSTPSGAKTNMYNQFGLNPFTSVNELDAGSTNLYLVGSSGTNLTVTLSAGWGKVTYTTQTVANAIVVRVPNGIEVAAQETNINSQLLLRIRDNSNTNVLYESTPAMTNFMGLTNNQTVAGAKSLTNIAGVFSGIISNSPSITGTMGGPSTANAWGVSNGYWWSGKLVSPVMTNAVNWGNAFTSKNAAGNGEQFGLSATATGSSALAVGVSALANGIVSTAVGSGAQATGLGATAFGATALAQNASDCALGGGATAKGTNSTALGVNAIVANGHTNSTAIGYGAATTAANQIMLGGSGINAVVQNSLAVGSGAIFADGITNLISKGTNTYAADADIAFTRKAVTSLANGNNAAVPVGTNTFVEVSGPSGAFTICGINGSPNRDGKFLIIVNQTGQNMTMAHESGTDPTAGNRIVSMTGADRATTGNGAAILIYSGAASRWILISLDP